MNDDFEDKYLALKQWAEAAAAAGWLSPRELEALGHVERQQAEAIFARSAERPLIVAFFGGTGVGKSSLLNRLAGEEIARVGVQRPTSQEVTLFLHQDYRLVEFPSDLPLEETRIAYHQDDSRRLIAWLDMPDIDSVEQRHRALVQSWLPYIDWLVYVVSPERYQDDLGWRFLQQRSARHSWLFIMNHSDEGVPEQVADLRDRLLAEGFTDPIILRTSCVEGMADDDFPRLEQIINQAIQEYGLEVLQRLGLQARLMELQRIAGSYQQKFEGYELQALQPKWKEHLERRLIEIGEELLLNARLQVQQLPRQEATAWYRPQPHEERIDLPKLAAAVWSKRIETRLQDLDTELENLLQQEGVPIKPFTRCLHSLTEKRREIITDEAERAMALALERPGSLLQRGMYWLSGLLSWLLPLSAASWAAWQLVAGFYAGTQGQADFLGVNFAIHSLLLVGVTWLLPWLLQCKLKPSALRSAEQGLRRGIGAGIDRLAEQGEEVFQLSQNEWEGQLAALRPLMATFSSLEWERASTLKAGVLTAVAR